MFGWLSPLKTLWRALWSRAMPTGDVPASSRSQGLGQGFLVQGRGGLSAVPLDKPVQGCPLPWAEIVELDSVYHTNALKSQWGKDTVSKATYYINRVKILFLSGFRLLEDEGHLVYFKYNLLISHLVYFTYNLLLFVSSLFFSLYNGHSEVQRALSLSLCLCFSLYIGKCLCIWYI